MDEQVHAENSNNQSEDIQRNSRRYSSSSFSTLRLGAGAITAGTWRARRDSCISGISPTKTGTTSSPEEDAMNESNSKGESNRIWIEVYASAVLYLSFLNCGFVGDWSGSVLTALGEDFQMGPTEVSLVASLPSIAGIISAPLCGKVSDKFGRKRVLLMFFPISVAGWLLIALAPSIYFVYVGRFINGCAASFYFIIGQVFISEFVRPSIRGTLCSLCCLFISAGVLIIYATGSFMSWRTTCYVCLAPEFVFFLGLFTLPESSYWYIMKGKKIDAENSLTYFRGSDTDAVQNELNDMHVKLTSVGQNIGIKELFKSRTRTPFLIALFTQSVQQLSGIGIIVAYTGNILESTKTTLDIRYATTYVGVSQFISTALSAILVDKVGRKALLSFSSLTFGISSVLLASYFLTLEYGFVWPDWVPVVALFCAYFFYAIGCRSVPGVVGTEIFNTAIRSRANALCGLYNRILNIIYLQVYPFLKIIIGDHGVFYATGTVAIVLGILTCFIVPETKGKSLEEIQEYFESRASKKKELKGEKEGVSNPSFAAES